jgi:hypothetical protein
LIFVSPVSHSRRKIFSRLSIFVLSPMKPNAITSSYGGRTASSFIVAKLEHPRKWRFSFQNGFHAGFL